MSSILDKYFFFCNKLCELHDQMAGIDGNLHDVMCVTETWLHESFSGSLLVNNLQYNVFRYDRRLKIGGGCAIFTRKIISAVRISFPAIVMLDGIEAVAVEINPGEKKLAVCCIYNPPGHNFQSIKSLCDIINHLCERYAHVCLLGDFNMPVINDCLLKKK